MSYTAEVTIEGVAPYSQSRMHRIPMLERESHEDYDARTWRDKAHYNQDGEMVIPAMGVKQALDAAAKYEGEKIKGKGNATFTKHFTSGVLLFDDLPILKSGKPVTRDDVIEEGINANANGKRGSGTRVWRRFPVVFNPWTATGTIIVLDHIITPEILERYLSVAGEFIGIGRFRPENGGSKGRFKINSITAQESM